MGRRRGRGQRTFNPHEKKRDVGQEVVDEFNKFCEKVMGVVRKSAMNELSTRFASDRKATIGEIFLESMAAALIGTAFELQKAASGHRRERKSIQDMVREEEEELLRSIKVSEHAANAAFPGVEDPEEP